jgi:hypothetical protein
MARADCRGYADEVLTTGGRTTQGYHNDRFITWKWDMEKLSFSAAIPIGV